MAGAELGLEHVAECVLVALDPLELLLGDVAVRIEELDRGVAIRRRDAQLGDLAHLLFHARIAFATTVLHVVDVLHHPVVVALPIAVDTLPRRIRELRLAALDTGLFHALHELVQQLAVGRVVTALGGDLAHDATIDLHRAGAGGVLPLQRTRVVIADPVVRVGRRLRVQRIELVHRAGLGVGRIADVAAVEHGVHDLTVGVDEPPLRVLVELAVGDLALVVVARAQLGIAAELAAVLHPALLVLLVLLVLVLLALGAALERLELLALGCRVLCVDAQGHVHEVDPILLEALLERLVEVLRDLLHLELHHARGAHGRLAAHELLGVEREPLLALLELDIGALVVDHGRTDQQPVLALGVGHEQEVQRSRGGVAALRIEGGLRAEEAHGDFGSERGGGRGRGRRRTTKSVSRQPGGRQDADLVDAGDDPRQNARLLDG